MDTRLGNGRWEDGWFFACLVRAQAWADWLPECTQAMLLDILFHLLTGC